MSKDQDPAFLMYSKDWLSGTAECMPDEKGVYIDLLCHQHQNGNLPTDIQRLARLVGLHEDRFRKIWSVISVHFEQEGDRLVNRKLQRLMNERANKGMINTITGTFAGLLRLGDFNAQQYKYLKSEFKPLDFIQYPKECLTERLTEWLQSRLKSIGNGNDNNNYKGVLEKVLTENSITLPEGYEPLILEWLKYKSEKGQSYKETGLKTFIKAFLKDSEMDLAIAKEMLEYSMSKNYTGLFRNNNNNLQSEKPEILKITTGEYRR